MNDVDHHTVVLVGLGEIGQVHLHVLEGMPGMDVVAVVDPSLPKGVLFRGREVPVYATTSAVGDIDPAVVVVATPTPTHVDVCLELLRLDGSAELLVEKPLATTAAEVRRVLASASRARRRLTVLLHAAFSPEVLWGRQQLQRIVSSGNVSGAISVSSWFTDPYARAHDDARRRFGSSWLDSGSNALSVLQALVEIEGLVGPTRVDELVDTFEAEASLRLGGARGSGHLVTSWNVTEAGKHTRVVLGNEHELLLDHTAVAGMLTRSGKIVHAFGSDGSLPRKWLHYRNVYEAWTRGDVAGGSERLHELLLGSYRHRAGPPGVR